jgi:hypothetical protein
MSIRSSSPFPEHAIENGGNACRRFYYCLLTEWPISHSRRLKAKQAFQADTMRSMAGTWLRARAAMARWNRRGNIFQGFVRVCVCTRGQVSQRHDAA